MKKIKFKVAMGQMKVESGKIKENLFRAEKMISDAAKKDCRIIVLPETMDLGWLSHSFFKLAQPIPGKISNFLCKLAKKYQISIVAGLTEKFNDKFYNSAVFISEKGEILIKHRKINELTTGQKFYTLGDSLKVVKTLSGTIGICICADLSKGAVSIGEALGLMRAQIILSPCSWAVKANHNNKKDPYGKMWKDSYTYLAKKYNITVIGVSNVGWLEDGPWKGKKCIGCSLAVGPKGIIAQLPYGEEREVLFPVEVELFPKPFINY